jgi:small-conductance mechanosensitive channel
VLLLWIHGLALAGRILASGFVSPSLVDTMLLVLRVCYGFGLAAGLIWLLGRIGRLVERFTQALATRSTSSWDDVMLPLAGRAARRILPWLGPVFAIPVLAITPRLGTLLGHAAVLLAIGVAALVLRQVVDAVAAIVLSQHPVEARNNLQARAIHTQVVVLRKVATTVIAVFTLASMLMVFEPARQFGASILASAGIAGIIVGFAAQRSIATLLAGFQIALTQPIRVDDVVIVEGEWGRIEEITLTYVVVRVWDLRRLILPITHFIEQPFQNWTRSSADILGTVFLYVDYSVPVDRLRRELTRILSASAFWDGKVNVLQVTDAKEHTLEIRALASAADASLAWDLRCEIREKLVEFIRVEHPESLPRFRATLDAKGPEVSRIMAHGARAS